MWRNPVVPVLAAALSFFLPVSASGVSLSDQGQVNFRIHYTLVEELRYEVPLPDSPAHWIRAAKFAGPVQGGPFDSGWAEELGLHDVFPGREGIGGPIYHVITAPDGSSLTLRGDRRLVTFGARAGEGPLNVYAGTWTVLGGTGAFADSQGGGAIAIRPLSPTEIVQAFTGTLR